MLLNIGNEELTEELAQSFLDAAEPGAQGGDEGRGSGQIGTELSEPETESSEVIGSVAAMVILALTFGTLVAMGMPILSAVLGLLVGLSIIGLLGHVTEVPTIAPTLATMIGLGVGIDYALFMVSRYRTQREEGMEIPDAIAKAVATSGTAIVFAGGTVVIALVSLLVAGIPLVTSLGYASAVRGGDRGARRDHAAAGAARAGRPPHRLAARCRPSCTRSRSRRTRASGRLGPVRDRPAGALDRDHPGPARWS